MNFWKKLWLLGGLLVAIGEARSAFNDKPNDTISEQFKALPLVVRFIIIFIYGMVFSHLIEWRIRDTP